MAEASSKRKNILTRLFVHDSDPNPKPRAGLDVNTVVFKYQNDQETRVPLAQFFGGTLPAPGVGRAAAAFGINTSAGNTVGTIDRAKDPETGKLEEPHPEDVKRAVEDRVQVFLDGRWASEAGPGGGFTSTKMDTLIKFRTEINGKPADEAWQAEMRRMLDESPDFWKDLMNDAEFAAVHEALKAERAAARAKAAAEAAKGKTGGLQI